MKMKKLLSLFLIFMLLPCVTLAEGAILPDIGAFSKGMLTVDASFNDDDYSVLTYSGNEDDVRRVIEAYMSLIIERYDMELVGSYDLGPYANKNRFRFFSSTALPEISTFIMADTFPICQLYVHFSDYSTNKIELAFSSDFTYEDTGDRLSDVVSQATADVCSICGGDRVCDTCGGAGYILMTLQGSNQPVQIACPAGCNIGSCPDCTVPCEHCGSDGLCDLCGGLAYTTATAFGSGELLKIACTGPYCHQGFCASCMPDTVDRFALASGTASQDAAAAPTPAPVTSPTPTPKSEPARTPKPLPTVVPSGQAVLSADGTILANLELYSNYEFTLTHIHEGNDSDDAPRYSFMPESSFSGSIASFAKEYADSLVDSGYYRLNDEYSSEDFYRLFLSYEGPEHIRTFQDPMLKANGRYNDISISVNTTDDYILIYLNPKITFYE